MVNSNETSIQVIRNKGILSKLINFVRKLFGKNNSNYFSITKEETRTNKGNNSFFKSIKFEEDPDKQKLLAIQEDLEKIGIAGAEIAELPIHLITSARTIQHIENIARKLKNKNDLGLLVIDYIQLIKNKGKFNNREQEVADITRTLKLLSLELDIPIIRTLPT